MKKLLYAQTLRSYYKINIKKAIACSLPLLILPLANLIYGLLILHGDNILSFNWSMLFMLLWVSIEEVVFRRVLPWGMYKLFCLSDKRNAILSSLVFALFHLVNIVQGASIFGTLIQIVFAFGMGYCLYALVRVCGSIVPGIIIHFLINITGNGLQDILISPIAFLWVILSIGCFVYGKWILRSIEHSNLNMQQ